MTAAVVGLFAASCSSEHASTLLVGADASTGSPAAPGARAAESPATRARVADVRSRFVLAPAVDPLGAPPSASRSGPVGRAVVKPGVATAFELTGSSVRAVLAHGAEGTALRPADVELPARADGAVRLADAVTALAISFGLEGAADASVEIADGIARYPGALGGADVLHRVDAAGTEDFVVFEQRPAREELRYAVDVTRVAGLRLVGNTLEFLDEAGAPRLRVAPPYVVSAAGERREARLAVEGCAYDADPRAPWGRTLTRPGAASCEVRVAWEGVAYPAIVDPTWSATGSMATARWQHAQLTLDDGRTLVAGGVADPSLWGTPLASAELYDATTGTWAAAQPLSQPHGFAGFTKLTDGRVLVAGGTAGAPAAVALSCTVSALGLTLPVPAALLGSFVSGFAALPPITDRSELYDPSVGTWTQQTMPGARAGFPLVAEPGGKAIAFGGVGYASRAYSSGNMVICGATGSASCQAGALPYSESSVAEFDAGTLAWTPSTPLPQRAAGAAAATLPDGSILVAGGVIFDLAIQTSPPQTACSLTQCCPTCLFGVVQPPPSYCLPTLTASLTQVPQSLASRLAQGTFLPAGAMYAPRATPSMTVTSDGRIVVANGDPSTEAYDPASDTWTPLGSLSPARPGVALLSLGSGALAIGGGDLTYGTSRAVDVRGSGIQWLPSAPLGAERRLASATPLSGGRVLVAGGVGSKRRPNVCGTCTPLLACPAPSNCGTLPDGCGGTLSCGTCTGADTCGGGGTPGVCGCKPLTACPAPDDCGTISDGCGGTLSCGTCGGGKSCGGGGTPNVCGTGVCVPKTACPAPDDCGTISDGCGGVLPCGLCDAPKTCGGGGTPNVCGCTQSASCPAVNGCGAMPDGCGGWLDCGTCTGGLTCGGGGVPNVCGCKPLTACPAPDDCGTIADGCGGTLSCGSCSAGQTCGGGGTPNVCATGACTPLTACPASANCGAISDGCSGILDCGTCAAGTICGGNSPDTVLATAELLGPASVGQPCGASPECASGFCVDGVCCDSACDATCAACSAVAKGGGADGACGLAIAGSNPHLDCPDDGAPSCRRAGTCDGSGACALYAKGTSCGADSCSGFALVHRSCDGSGACSLDAVPCGNGLYACADAATCAASCALDADCAPGAHCRSAACVKDAPNGAACTVDAACASGHCADGVCCSATCDGQCEACAETGAVGSCIPVTGPPRLGRSACSTDAGGTACAASQCDGSNRTTCAGHPGSETTCRAESCADGVESAASFCDGTGTCPAPKTHGCDPYRCAATSCKTSCTSDADCATDARCDVAGGVCNQQASCDGDHTVKSPSGGVRNCAPYRCDPAGTCKSSCQNVDDCAAPSVCDTTGHCVAPSAGAGAGDAQGAGDCGCRAAGAQGRTAGAWAVGWVVATAALLARRRRAAWLRPSVTLAAVGAAACAPSDRPGTDPVALVGDGGSTRERSTVLGDGRIRLALPSGSAPKPVVTLPAWSDEAFELSTADERMAVTVRLEGVERARARIAGDRIVYAASGRDVLVHRPRPDGTEDWVTFDSGTTSVTYRLVLARGVSGARLVASTLELLDAAGTPRLRMAPPFVLDAKGVRHAVGVRVEDCRISTSPAPPWGTAPIDPGSGECRVVLDLASEAVAFPAVLDPAWTTTGALATPRVSAAAVALPGGRALLAGGKDASAQWVASADVLDPTTKTWAATSPLPGPRGNPAGGPITPGALVIGSNAAIPTGDVYDAASGTWPSSSTLPVSCVNGPCGVVGLDGGGAVLYGGGGPVARYDAVSGTYTVLPALSGLDATTVALPGDRFAGVGGRPVADGTTSSPWSSSNVVRIWDPTSGAYVLRYLALGREDPAVATVASGALVVVGGRTETCPPCGISFIALNDVEAVDTGSGAPAKPHATSALHVAATAVALSGGRVAVIDAYPELLDLATGASTPIPYTLASHAYDFSRAVSLGGDRVLLVPTDLTVAPALLELQPNGAPCTSETECGSAHCRDGVCCDVACDAPCMACAAAAKQSGDAAGTCGPAKAGADPHDDCVAADPTTCGATGTCDGAGACARFPAGAACGPSACLNGVVGEATCDGNGVCAAATHPCDPYACADSSGCATTCSTDQQCASSAYCDPSAKVCKPKEALGTTCGSAGKCASGFCVDGVCCDAPCTGQCEACDASGVLGQCVPVKGAPHGRTACDAASPSAPCEARRCNGADRTTCAGWADSKVACGAAACEHGEARFPGTCDGAGNCAGPNPIACLPFACGADACKTTCASDDDCAIGAFCTAEHSCTTGASCLDVQTLRHDDGTTVDCAPFVCEGAQCKASCASVDDCVAPAICDAASHLCASPPQSGAADSRGCGCEAPGRSSGPASAPWLVVGAFGLLQVGRWRRRRARSLR